MSEYDLVVRSGTVVDGSGGEPFRADVAVVGGRVAEVGRVRGTGAREVDAEGAVVAPGFVDIHTHYDGQAAWDSTLQPSSWHGVTTVVGGNCGVGFAPVKPEDRDQLIALMEGVEDIPGTALHEGLSWDWETFGDYLDALERRPRDLDYATQVPHAALRIFAMGRRAVAREAATREEIAQMARLAVESIAAGALGFTTSRTLNHKTKTGVLTPVYGSADEELVEISRAVGGTGTGVLQLITDFDDVAEDFALMRQMAKVSGRPLSVSVFQNPVHPGRFREILAEITAANAAGLEIRAQVGARGMGILLGLQCTLHPFTTNRVWRTIAHLPVAEQAARMADPRMRAAILAAQTDEKDTITPGGLRTDRYDAMHELGPVPDYEPPRAMSLRARAEREHRTPEEVAYDVLVKDEGRGIIYQPFTNYAEGNLDAVREMLGHPHTVPGLGDGGAHVGSICDSSFPSTLLQHWVRERPHGRLALPFVVQRQSRDTARAVGLRDRGELKPGFKADLNVIDLDRMRTHRPEMVYDLPGGGRRLLQRVEGYRHTFVSGVETYREGEPTGALPGRVVRGARSARPA
ncbi:amidohydrolase family protein [Yinghuangia sp. ASG 101]|uniref:N-acyl-D-amino-acid deacylase family protein n=1 Tax=Yinghuangia sp. ASG 101 TaxID=2896848 RepID=UPI001E34EA94|nr:amidohydrolase family protein [Yinghuangia sp. ASG 101]UGQ11135.1 amidohydrolase family protein [Yinghuangia sp. ASG 101]